jgi:hypothetical protein
MGREVLSSPGMGSLRKGGQKDRGIDSRSGKGWGNIIDRMAEEVLHGWGRNGMTWPVRNFLCQTLKISKISLVVMGS